MKRLTAAYPELTSRTGFASSMPIPDKVCRLFHRAIIIHIKPEWHTARFNRLLIEDADLSRTSMRTEPQERSVRLHHALDP